MTLHRTYYEDEIEDEIEELYEMGLIDECGNWIDHTTIIGYTRS